MADFDPNAWLKGAIEKAKAQGRSDLEIHQFLQEQADPRVREVYGKMAPLVPQAPAQYPEGVGRYVGMAGREAGAGVLQTLGAPGDVLKAAGYPGRWPTGEQLQSGFGLTGPSEFQPGEGAHPMLERAWAAGWRGAGAGALLGPEAAVYGAAGGLLGEAGAEAGLPPWKAALLSGIPGGVTGSFARGIRGSFGGAGAATSLGGKPYTVSDALISSIGLGSGALLGHLSGIPGGEYIAGALGETGLMLGRRQIGNAVASTILLPDFWKGAARTALGAYDVARQPPGTVLSGGAAPSQP